MVLGGSCNIFAIFGHHDQQGGGRLLQVSRRSKHSNSSAPPTAAWLAISRARSGRFNRGVEDLQDLRRQAAC